ncbi:MAG: hypothetical protein D3909_17285 [Candidatus Electrothrix sp. ATG1]|nr:hypothetical protein [Candidatus Electrothrix sp. ATG1]
MKLADSNSRLGKKLSKWLPHDKKEDEPEGKKRRHNFHSIDDPETKLEKRIKQWFTDEEKKDRPLIIKENVGAPVQIFVITYQRAILFEAGLFYRLKDVSDKVWRQFVSVHLTENIFSSSLTLRFFPYNDSTPYYNPSDEKKSLERWYLNRLKKEDARRAYSVLKDKELYWQEKRRQEQVALRKPFGKPPGGGGGAPPPKKN